MFSLPYWIYRNFIAIDVWSAGVTLLCILCGQFPFFQSNDDGDAILEIAHIYGKKKMESIARSLSMFYFAVFNQVST